MELVNVTAQECNSDGHIDPQQQRTEMKINTDMVAAIIDDNVILKDGARIALGDKYFTDFETTGSCNYALTLVLKRPDPVLCENVMQALREHGVEFRRGLSGGGNQLRQPFLKAVIGEQELKEYPNVDHVHFYGFYIGNYPTLEKEKILRLCSILNGLPGQAA